MAFEGTCSTVSMETDTLQLLLLTSTRNRVKSISPIHQISMKNGYDENNNYSESYGNKCATNFSFITNNKWNVNAHNNMHLTKHDTNDDVDTLHLHLNGRVAYMH